MAKPDKTAPSKTTEKTPQKTAAKAVAKAAVKPAAPPEKPRRWRQGPVNVGALTGRLTRPALGKRGFAGADILAHWPTIVGAELAAFACPLEVKYPKGRNAGATLHLRVSHGAAAAMLHMRLPAIMERINRFFGYDAVVQVQAAQGPLPVKRRAAAIPDDPLPPETVAAVEHQVAGVASADIKEALIKLGKALQHRRR